MKIKLTGQLSALIGKDLSLSLFSLPGWLFIIVFDLILLWLFLQSFFLIGQTDLNGFFSLFPWSLIILAGALSLKAFSQEKQKQTLELLLSLPISATKLVLAKFLSGLIIFLFIGVSFLPFILIVGRLGPIDWGQIISAWIGTAFLFSLFLAYAIFISLFFKNSVFNFLFNVFSLFVIYVVGMPAVLNRLPVVLSRFLVSFSLSDAWQSFLIGVPSLAGLVLFSSFAILFLSLAVIKLRSKSDL